MSTAAINPSTQAAASTYSPTSTANALADQNTFLQLMIAELEHQDPANPADGTQFITQLAEFSSVASQAQSASDLDAILQLMQQNAAANAQTSGTSGS